jgi:4-alpha-glucanotransferase
MARIQLILAIHSHQPVGNFDHVFEQAYDRCYRLVLDRLAQHPRVRVAFHHTGPLLEWLSEHRPDYLKDLRLLADRGQVEILGGGFYEPMLSVLPDVDATGQIEMMRSFCEQRFGQSPAGMWLAERVWEPDLPRVLAPCGVRYTFLDDSHFFAAGVTAPRLFGHYVTEKAGYPVSVFPIDKGLRYRIPFKPVREVLDDLDQAAKSFAPQGEDSVPVLTYGDDGEKFGLWPGTYGWVHEQGWLNDFLTGLEDNGDLVETVLPKDVVANHPPTGRIYLPTASYEEMMEWAMPADAIRRYEEFRARLGGDWEKYRAFVRGGIWQSFFSKYAEANHLHKRMLHVSARLQEAIAEKGEVTENLDQARVDLYRGQCNCPYWHGLFGGLYLNYLRAATHRALIRAENRIDDALRGTEEDFIEYDELDFDADLADEVYVANAKICTYLDPGTGGALVELDYRPRAYNVADVLSRRDEAYHDALRKLGAESGSSGSAPASIHDRVRAKEPDLVRYLVHDGYRRALFVDRFHDPGATLEGLQAGGDGDIGDFVGRAYRVESSGVDEDGDLSSNIVLVRDGTVRRGDQRIPIHLKKAYRIPIDQPSVEVRYSVENRSSDPVELIFAPELNLTLLAGDAADRYFELSGGARHRMNWRAATREVREVALVEAWAGFKLQIALGREAEMWCYPVETVSQSEDGFERTYQGSCLLLRTPLLLAPGQSESVAVNLRFDAFQPTEQDRCG